MIDGFERPIPPAIVASGALLMAVSIAVVGVAHATHAGARAPGHAVQSRALRLEAAPDGALDVSSMDGRRLRVVAPGRDTFLRSVAEKLMQERRSHALPFQAPYQLVRWADGRLSLIDPATRREIHLESFGSANEADVAGLLSEKGTA